MAFPGLPGNGWGLQEGLRLLERVTEQRPVREPPVSYVLCVPNGWGHPPQNPPCPAAETQGSAASPRTSLYSRSFGSLNLGVHG